MSENKTLEVHRVDGTVETWTLSLSHRCAIAVDYVGTVVIDDILRAVAVDVAEDYGMEELAAFSSDSIVLLQIDRISHLTVGPAEDPADSYIELPPIPCELLIGLAASGEIKVYG